MTVADLYRTQKQPRAPYLNPLVFNTVHGHVVGS